MNETCRSDGKARRFALRAPPRGPLGVLVRLTPRRRRPPLGHLVLQPPLLSPAAPVGAGCAACSRHRRAAPRPPLRAVPSSTSFPRCCRCRHSAIQRGSAVSSTLSAAVTSCWCCRSAPTCSSPTTSHSRGQRASRPGSSPRATRRGWARGAQRLPTPREGWWARGGQRPRPRPHRGGRGGAVCAHTQREVRTQPIGEAPVDSIVAAGDIVPARLANGEQVCVTLWRPAGSQRSCLRWRCGAAARRHR